MLRHEFPSIRMCRLKDGVLKGQHHRSPGQSGATPWVYDIKMNSSLFSFCAGDRPAQTRKEELERRGLLPRAPVAATSALGYFRVAPPGRKPNKAAGAEPPP